ncbi:hypothetical protein [Acuticoccus yangtzensis]|uniref:hypothetical protein n=1 Tax=Acuticoccus yangtzensis TaxID=1443441 RepID=UPI000D3E7602|nr:hypothetical protein [Acuticoccus yangtzensis]
MSGDRKPLQIPTLDDDLDDFAPRPKAAGPVSVDAKKAVDTHSAFPSREAAPDGQLNLKGPRPILERFKALCKEDRRPYYDMLEILMDTYEGKR